MKSPKKILSQLRSKLLSRDRAWATQFLGDLPEVLSPATIYLVGERRYVWSVAMLCPCGCGDMIHLNALPEIRPRWSVRRHRDGAVSLHPSIWRNTGCRSHFSLRRGRAVWFRQLKSKRSKQVKLCE